MIYDSDCSRDQSCSREVSFFTTIFGSSLRTAIFFSTVGLTSSFGLFTGVVTLVAGKDVKLFVYILIFFFSGTFSKLFSLWTGFNLCPLPIGDCLSFSFACFLGVDWFDYNLLRFIFIFGFRAVEISETGSFVEISC